MSVDFSKLASLLEKEHQVFVKTASEPASSQWKSLFGEFARDLQTYVHPLGLEMSSSWGIGKRTYFPWIRLYFPEMSISPQKGIFIDYLFGWEDHEVFLTLLQGVDGDRLPKIAEMKKLVQSNVDCSSFEKSQFSLPVTRGTMAKCNRAESYADGMIFHKKYTQFNLPEAGFLEADLKEIIGIYVEVKKLCRK